VAEAIEDGTLDLKEAFNYSSFRSGLLRLTIMKLLSVKPMHGYALMKEIDRISEHSWKPSPGSIYPALQGLQRSEIVAQDMIGRKRIYQLTPKGKLLLDQAMERIRTSMVNLQNLLDYGPHSEA
jgi:DNA-binding PadR family transcriptional regulator